MLGSVSGAVTMVVALLGFVMIHEAGHFIAAKATGMKATQFFLGFGPKVWSFTKGETEYGVKLFPAGGYVRIIGMNPFEEIAPEDEGRTYRDKSASRKLIVILSGIALNFIVAFGLLWGIFVSYGDQEWVPNTTVYAIVEDSAAATAGIVPGDVIESVDGVALATWDDLVGVVGARPGETVDVVLVRDGVTETLSVTLGSDNSTGQARGFLGIGPDAELVISEVGFFEGAGRAGGEVVRLTGMAYGFIGDLVRPSTIGELVGGVSGGEVDTESRPVSIIGLARIGSQAEEIGTANLLYLMASINVILGSFNVIPLLPLDGGHAAIAIYEKVSRRKANLQAMAPIAAAVIALFIFIGVLSLILDITNPFSL